MALTGEAKYDKKGFLFCRAEDAQYNIQFEMSIASIMYQWQNTLTQAIRQFATRLDISCHVSESLEFECTDAYGISIYLHIELGLCISHILTFLSF